MSFQSVNKIIQLLNQWWMNVPIVYISRLHKEVAPAIKRLDQARGKRFASTVHRQFYSLFLVVML